MKQYFEGLTTGGSLMRDLSDIQIRRTEYCGYIANSEFSGNIDAPEFMPGGSMVNTDCKDFRGNAIISQTIATR